MKNLIKDFFSLICVFLQIVIPIICILYFAMLSSPHESFEKQYIEFKVDTTTYIEMKYIYDNGHGGIPVSTVFKKY